MLLQVNGDTDAAIEFLIAAQGADEFESEHDQSFEVSDGSNVCIDPPVSCDGSADQVTTPSSSGVSRDNNKLDQDPKVWFENPSLCTCILVRFSVSYPPISAEKESAQKQSMSVWLQEEAQVLLWQG